MAERCGTSVDTATWAGLIHGRRGWPIWKRRGGDIGNRLRSNRRAAATDSPRMESLSSDAQLLRAVPITTVSQWGTLRLDSGRLSFTKRSGDTVFDVPANEIHSVRPMTSMGIHVWHGTTRYRVATGVPSVAIAASGVPTGIPGAVTGAASIPGRIARDATNRAVAASWIEVLTSLQGVPPDGVTVRAPWPTWTWYVGIVAATLVLVALIAAFTLATG
jgi:hypothetical protein